MEESVTRPGCIWMIGTAPDGKGGIAAVVRGYEAWGLLKRENVRYLVTHRGDGSLTKLFSMLVAMPVFWGAILLRRVSIVHAHVSYGPSFWRKLLLLLPAFLLRVPVLCHLHAGSFQEYFDTGGALRRYAIHFMFGRAFRVIVLTSAWDQWVRSVVPGAQTAIIPNSIDESFGSQISDRGPVDQMILFLGRIGLGKGTFDLLDAFAALKMEFPEARLVCGGDGDANGLTRSAQKLGVDGSVDCVGWVGTEEKKDLLAKAAIFALPSYREGLPMALLEAMAFSLPVVSCSVGGIPQVVVDGKSGLLVEPGDIAELTSALRKLLADRDLRLRFGQVGRRIFDEKFSHRANLPKLCELYRLAASAM